VRGRDRTEFTMDDFLDRAIPEPNSGCWLWLGSHVNGGYAKVYLGAGRYMRATRWLLGEIGVSLSNGLLACHKCDNPGCVNPQHLFAGTMKDNILDAKQKNRLYRGGAHKPWNRDATHCKRGHHFSLENTRITNGKVRQRLCRICLRMKAAERRSQ
jgi:hypothetical protein